MKIYSLGFMVKYTIAEARCFLALQAFNEVVHAETYALQLETYVPENEEREKLFNAIDTVPTVGKKSELGKKNGLQQILLFLFV